MTEQEKQQLVEAVITQLKNEGTDVSNATVVSGADGIAYVLCYDNNNNIVRATPSTFDGITEVTWEQSSHIDDYIEAGVYDIAGTRWRNDGLPINNMGENATIAAKLFVTVTPEGATTYRHSIGHTLILTNAEGKETKVYTRNGNKTSTDGGVSYTITWGDWSNLQTNINVKQVEDLDELIDNGIYSGVWLRGTDYMSFVCVVINDYALSSSPRRVSQFIYGLNKVSGNVEYLTRIGEGDTNIVWGSLKIINEDKISELIENHDKDVTAIYNAIDANTTKITAEMARAKGEEQKLNIAIAEESLRAQNRENDLAAAINTGLDDLGTEFTEDNKTIKGNAMQYNTLGVTTYAGKAEIYGRSIYGNPKTVDIPAATTEKAGVMSAEDKREQVKMTPLVNGDVIVGQSREVYSRTGKPDSATFLKRTTAGGTSIGGGVATLKQVGGNIVKNLVDATNTNSFWGITSFNNNVFYSSPSAGGITMKPLSTIMDSHKYYIRVEVYSNSAVIMRDMFGNDDRTTATSSWQSISVLNSSPTSKNMVIFESGGSNGIFMRYPLVIDLTEMFGAGNEPSKEECDKLFGTMDALPMGLTVANPTSFKSVGYNQANPANILVGKGIEDGAIVDKTDSNVAVIECLPCKIGVGENNGYCIHGDFAEGEEVVYLSPLNPMTTEGELYMHQLYRDEDKGTYVPQIKGYMLVEVPRVTNLCVHFLWSEDRGRHDYEPYHESVVALPNIPEMSKWGLAGIKAKQDVLDLGNNRYIKRIGVVADLGGLTWYKSYVENLYVSSQIDNDGTSYSLVSDAKYYNGYNADGAWQLNAGQLYIWDSTFSDVSQLKDYLKNKPLFYQLLEEEEYPIVVTDKNYISSDYGTEEFDAKIPLNANNLYYQRSLVGETRNFLDRLMAGLGTDDVTAIADRIITALSPAVVNNDIIEEEV